MSVNTSFTFHFGSTSNLQVDLALIDLGGTDAGAGNTHTFKLLG